MRVRRAAAMRSATAGALLAALCLAAPAEAAEECTLCTVAHAGDTWDSRVAWYACDTARALTCAEDGECWITPILRMLIDTSRNVVAKAPAIIACSGGDCGGGPSLLFGVFLIAAASMLAIHATQLWWPNQQDPIWPWTLLRIVVGTTLAYALGAGSASTLHHAAGIVAGLGAAIGKHLPFSGGSATHCHAPAAAPAGWDQVVAYANAMFLDVLDLGGALITIGITLLPDIGGIFTLFSDAAKGLGSGNLEGIAEFLRFLFAFSLIMSAATLIALFMLTLIEAIMTTSLAFALSPLIALLWIWRSMRGAAHAALAATVYTALVIAIAALVLQLTFALTERAVVSFATAIENPDYAGASGCSPGDTLHSAVAYYVCLTGAEPDAEGDPATRIQANIAGWLPAVIVLMVTVILATALLRYAAGAASELTGHQPGTSLASSALAQAKQLGSSAAGRLRGR